MLAEGPSIISATGTFVVDMIRNLTECMRAEAWFPYLMKSSRMPSMSRHKLLLKSEMGFAMCFPSMLC